MPRMDDEALGRFLGSERLNRPEDRSESTAEAKDRILASIRAEADEAPPRAPAEVAARIVQLERRVAELLAYVLALYVDHSEDKG